MRKSLVVILSVLFAVSGLWAEPSQYVLDLGDDSVVREDDGDAVIAVTEEGNPYYVTAGWCYTYTPRYYGRLLVTKSNTTGTTGALEWERMWPAAGQPPEGKTRISRAENIIQAKGGGYLVLGGTNDEDPLTENGDFLLLKFSPQGDCEWVRAYGSPRRDCGTNMRYLKDTTSGDTSGYVLFGFTMTPEGDYDWLAIDVGLEGDTLPSGHRRLLGPTIGGVSADEVEAEIYETSDGSYLLLGYCNSQSEGLGEQQAIAEKWSKQWDPVWGVTFGAEALEGIPNFVEYNGEYLVGGGINPGPAGGTQDMLFAWLDPGTGDFVAGKNPVAIGTESWDFCSVLLPASDDPNYAMVGGWVGRTAQGDMDSDMLLGRFHIGLGVFESGWRIGEELSGNQNDLGFDLIPGHGSGYVEVGRSETWGQGGPHGDDLVFSKFDYDSTEDVWRTCTGSRIPDLTYTRFETWTTDHFNPAAIAPIDYDIHQVELDNATSNPNLTPYQHCLTP